MLDSIAQNPFLFPKLPDIVTPQLDLRRALVHRTYHIVFIVDGQDVFIVRVFHGSRNPAQLLGQ